VKELALRWSSVLGVLALLATNAAGAADLPDLPKRGTLRVLAVLSKEEAYFISPNRTPLPGFDLEVLDGFAQLHNFKVEVVPIPGWDALIPALKRQEGDLIAGGLTETESRRKRVAFTVEVFPTRSVVITRKPQKVVTSLEELRAVKVGTIKGTFMEEELAAAGVTNLDRSIGTGGLPEALRSGRIDAAVDGIEAALTARARDPELQLGIFLGRPASLAYAVRMEDQELLAALNSYIGNLRRTSTWSRLAVKYFGERAPEILKKARAE